MSEDPELTPGMEPLTPEEKEAFLRRVRAQARSLTSEEQYALFGPPPEPQEVPPPEEEEIEEMEGASLNSDQVGELAGNFFPDLPANVQLPEQRLIQGIIFDFE